MKKIIYLVSFFVLVVCLTTCEEVVNLKDMGVKPKLVLFCFLSPQYDTISVYLSNSQPLFSSDRILAEVKDAAVVEISNDNQHWTRIHYNKDRKRYLLPQTQFPVMEGKTYYIRASAENYESISASCTVPFWRETNPKPELDSVPNSEDYRYFNTLLYFSWNDYPNEKNYYALMHYNFWEGIDSWSQEEEVLKNYLTYYYVRTEEFSGVVISSDEGKNGQKMNLPFKTIEHCSPSEFVGNDMRYDGLNYDSIYVFFIQTDENLFLYENSADIAVKTEGLGSIFTVEPTLVYSNIKNGFGIFGAMNFKSYRLNFRKKTIEEAQYQRNNPVGMRERRNN